VAPVFSVMIVEKHQLAVAGCENGTLGFFRLGDWRPIATLVDQHTSAVCALATADDGDTLLSGSTKMVRTDLKALLGRGAIVASVELGGYSDGFTRFMSVTKPRLDYKFRALKELYTTAQLASFGFTAASVPEHKELREAMEWVRHLGISTEGLFPPIFATACAVVCLFAVIVVAQESVEFRKFVKPQSKLKYLWLAMSGYCELLSTVFFVPVCRILARAGDCTYDRGFGEGSGSGPDTGSGSGSSTDGGGLMWLDAMVRGLPRRLPVFVLSAVSLGAAALSAAAARPDGGRHGVLPRRPLAVRRHGIGSVPGLRRAVRAAHAGGRRAAEHRGGLVQAVRLARRQQEAHAVHARPVASQERARSGHGGSQDGGCARGNLLRHHASHCCFHGACGLYFPSSS